MQRLGRLREGVARWFFQQLVLGLDYCHKRGVANRDIKLENTLLQVCVLFPLGAALVMSDIQIQHGSFQAFASL